MVMLSGMDTVSPSDTDIYHSLLRSFLLTPPIDVLAVAAYGALNIGTTLRSANTVTPRHRRS